MAYGSLAAADTYHADRGNATWAAASEADREAALLRASAYIDARYRERLRSGRWVSMFTGAKTDGRAQTDEWPRTGATDYEGNAIADDVVPLEVEQATYEAALIEVVTPGALSPAYDASKQRTAVSVGPVSVSYADTAGSQNGMDGHSPPNRPTYPFIDELLAPVLVKRYDYPGVVTV